MDKANYTYKSKLILAGVLIWEAVFWFLFVAFLWMMGYFSNGGSGTLFGFKFPEKLNYLYLLVPLFGAFYWLITWKNKRLNDLANASTLSYLTKPVNSFRTFLTFFFLRNTIAFIVLSIAQPVFGNKKVSGTLESMELVLAIDVSNSMNTKDIESTSSRLQIVKRAMSQLVNQLHGEKIGISIFAGNAYLQLPLTIDYEAAKMYISEIETEMVSNQGTNIAASLEVSREMFSKERTGKAILLITDGENHEGGIDEPLAGLKEDNILLAVMGVGTTQGGLIPNDPDRPEMGYKTTESGSTIVSKLNPGMVEELAQKGGGFSMICSTPYPNLNSVIDRLAQVKRAKVDSMELDVKENWYQIPLFFAILCFLGFQFSALIGTKKSA